SCIDPTGLLFRITDNASNRSDTYCSDASGRLTNYYDANNDPLSNGQAKFTQFIYDMSGRLTDVVDPLNNDTNIAYVGTSNQVDHFTRATGTTNAATTTFSYSTQNCSGVSGAGKTVVTDADSHATTYCWDQKGRVLKVLDAKGNSASTSYNSRSNV